MRGSQIQLQSICFSFFFSLYLEILFAWIIKSLLPCGSRGSKCGREEATGASSRGGGTAKGQDYPFRFRARLITAHLASPHGVAALPSQLCPTPSHPHRAAGAAASPVHANNTWDITWVMVRQCCRAFPLLQESRYIGLLFLFLQLWHETLSLSCLSELRSVEGF